MKGLSKKEIEIISELEFYKKYFFESSDIDKFVANKGQKYHTIKKLIQKERIVKLNKSKYYLVPIKAKSGKWGVHEFILADEICNGKDYYIGGWSALNYWQLTDQIPMQVDIYTTRRQGRTKILNIRVIFHRTSERRIEKAVEREIEGHKFKIISKEEAEKWIKSKKNYEEKRKNIKN